MPYKYLTWISSMAKLRTIKKRNYYWKVKKRRATWEVIISYNTSFRNSNDW